DKDGASGSGTFQVNVANQAPVVTAAANQNAGEGSAVAFNLGSFYDAGVQDNPWAVQVSWGDGAADTSAANSTGSLGTLAHSFAANGVYTVTVKVTDKDGASDSGTFHAYPTQRPSDLTAAANQNAGEGSAVAFNLGSFYDAGVKDNPWAVQVSWGDGSADTFSTTSTGSLGTLAHSFADNGVYTVTVTVTDKDNTAGSGAVQVNVANQAPVVTAAGNQTANEGSAVAFDLGSFADAGTQDSPWAVQVSWGDGSAAATFSTSTQGSLGTLAHSFTDNGAYTVTVKVTDKDGASSS